MFSLIEQLEGRTLMSSTWTLSSGLLTVNGTAGADNIYVSTAAGGNFVVYDKGVKIGNAIPATSVKKVVINCGAGNDYAYVGSLGNIPVTLKGGDGNDGLTNTTTARADIYGDAGDDNLTGGSGGDLINGGAGNDGVSGATGNDTLYGGDGTDLLVGGVGNDSMDGGLGADRFRGGSGTDTVSYAARTVSIFADITEGNGELPDDGAANEKDFVEADNEILIGGSAADKLVGATFPSTYSSASGYTKNNKLVGNGGNDTLLGLDGNDTIEGNAGNDSLQGGDGNDNLNPGTGTDQIIGGNGIDTADYAGRSENLKITLDGLANDGAPATSTTPAENDKIYSDVENANGGGGADSITGNAANNVLHGNGGNDTLHGLAGNDTIYGDSGTDALYGDDGNDVFYAKDTSFKDSLFGGNGTDKANRDATSTVTDVLNSVESTF